MRKTLLAFILFFILCLNLNLAFAEEKEALYVKIGHGEMKISGYIQGRFTNDDATGQYNQFSIPRARLKVSGSVIEQIKYVVSFESTKSPVLKDAYIELDYIPHAEIRVGQFKTPFGVEGVESSTKIPTILRTEVTEALYQERDIGIMVHGKYKGAVDINYGVALINGSTENTADANDHKDIIGRIGITPLEGLAFGVSGYDGKEGAADLDKTRWGADLEYLPAQVKGLKLRAEYITGELGTTESDGWYALTTYRLPQNVEGVLRYDVYDPNKDVSNDKVTTTTVGLNYYLVGDTRVLVDYESKDDEATTGDDNIFLAQLQVMF